MKRFFSLVSMVLGAAILLAPTAYGASYSLRRTKTWRPSSSFRIRRYQRPQLRHRRYARFRSIESRTSRRKNYMPTNQQRRTGRNRHYKRPERTKGSRNPSMRSAGRKRRTIRRRVRWAPNR